MRALLGCLFFFTLAVNGAQKRHIGAAACRPCHTAEFAGQSASGHAEALFRASEHPLAAKFETSEPVLRAPNFRFEFGMAGGVLRVRADDGQYVTELPIEWAFGAGDHAVTFVSKVSGEYYLEHSLSYYPAAGTFALTPRHDALTATTLHQAMGQPIQIRGPGGTIADCFGCHSTGPVSISANGEPQIAETGVRCEVCHGPGSEHRDAAARGEKTAARLIDNPGKMNGEEMNRFCGRCHRVIGPSFDWNSPWSVRHQPPYLARSRCFLNSGGKISCVSCHNPHEKVRRNDAAYYAAKCGGCHSTGNHPPSKICLAEKNSDCVRCHMPAVAFDSRLTFANHWIGVYKQGALKPVR